MKKLLLGVDFGGSKTAIGLISQKGKIISKKIFSTPAQSGPHKVLDSAFSSIKQLLQENNIPINKILGIGIGSPGQIDFNKGTVSDPPNLKNWKTVPVKKIFEREFPVEIKIDNDANAAALGELFFGAGKRLKYFVYMTVSTGIGGGVIIDKKVYRGFFGGAGEIGHMIIAENGPQCGCGNKGCLEALGAGFSIRRRALEKIKQGRNSKILDLVNGNLAKIDPIIIEKAAKTGDSLAKEIWNETGYFIGIGVANLINIFNPQAVIIGGGVSKAGKLLFDPLCQSAKKNSFPLAYKSCKIIPAALGDDVGILGAAALLLEK